MFRRISSLLMLSSFLMCLSFVYSANSLNDLIGKHIKRPPRTNKSQPLGVHIGFYVESIGNFQETQMTFDADMYMYLSWRDPSLNHSRNRHIMLNDNSVRNKMWLPDLYFANAKSAHFHDVMVPNFNIFIASDGTISYSCRVTLTVACNLNLKNYPMDIQNCHIRILSYAYVAALVNVSWFKSDAIRYNPAISLPEYRIASVSPNYCNGTYRYAVMEHSYRIGSVSMIDKFSCLVATIRLERSLGFTLVQSYIPTSLIVIISWVSFWIDRSAVPARVTLSFSTMLSLTTLGNGLRYGLPQVSYAKAIDYWFGACMCFVFCSLLQFAVVNSYMRKSEKNDKLSARHLQKAGQINYSTAAMPIYGLHQINRELLEKLKCKDKKRASASHVKADSNVISVDDAADRLLLLNNIYEAYIKDTEPQNAEANKLSDRSMKRLENSATLRQLLLDGIFKEPELILAEYHAQLANKYSHVALSIDKSCRYIFPLAFILWNLAYWGYYLLNDPLFASRR